MVCETTWFEWGHIYVFPWIKKFFMASVKSTRWKTILFFLFCFLIKCHRLTAGILLHSAPVLFCFSLTVALFLTARLYPYFIILFGEIFFSFIIFVIFRGFYSFAPSNRSLSSITNTRQSSVIKIQKLETAIVRSKREVI